MKKELKDESLSKVTGGGLGGPSEGLIPHGGGMVTGNNSNYICPDCGSKFNYADIIKSGAELFWTCPNSACGKEKHHKEWKKAS